MNNDKDHRFDLPPFSLGHAACGVNALIDVLHLTTQKLNFPPAISSIAGALVQISENTLPFSTSLGNLNLQLQQLIDKMIIDDETHKRFNVLLVRNYDHLSKGELL